MKPVILYEIYSKRAIHEPIAGLVILDRDTNKKKAILSAIRWGAVVVRIEARILTKYPLTREVLSSAVIWIHKPAKRIADRPNTMTRKVLMGKLRQNSKSLYRGYRR